MRISTDHYKLLCPLLLLILPAPLCAEKPARGDTADLAKYDASIKPEHRAHWAFQRAQSVSVPKVTDATWVRNPIDAFILAKLEEKGWKPSPAAEPRALLRRLYLDLIGLPPTPAEQEAFLNDASPDKVEKVVADLLARPSYGERWGRHWLDLVRYAETNGYELDHVKPNAWRYRDYVIRSFNEDKPYDRFIIEQLAGDELPEISADTLVATSYYRIGPWDPEPADPLEDRFDQIDDMINTTSQAFLGLTLACARCHNHKFDPLTQHDYYRMAAVFDPLKRTLVREGEFLLKRELDLPVGTRPQLDAQNRRDRQFIMLWGSALSTGVARGAYATPLGASVLDWVERGHRIEQLRKAQPDLPRAYLMPEPSPRPPVSHLLLRGKAASPGPKVGPGVPAVLVESQPPFLPPNPRTSQRRLSLARWIANPDNPLTARVIVNRIWQFHFGEGLVRTPSDFGTIGDAPTHPELLDWLAGWFAKEGWSIKKLHRLILASNTYRISKRWNIEYGAEDPENRLLWRFPFKRLEVEAIRDSMLAVSGQLNAKMFGPPMYPEVPKEVLDTQHERDKAWKPFDEKEASRRTIYAHVKRGMIVPMFEVLDFCDTARSSAKRNVSTVAPQALSLLNGEFVNRQAKHFAERLIKEAGDDPGKQIERACALALSRPPRESERAEMLRFLKEEAGGQADATGHRRALEQLGRAVFNLNEFVYPD